MTRMPPLPKIIAIGVTLDPEFDDVVRWLDATFGSASRFVFIHAIELPPLPTFLSGGMESQDRIRDAMMQQAETALGEWAEAVAPGRNRVVVRTGRAHDVLHAVAEEVQAELLVVRRHEEQPIRKRILGSTAERTLVSASIPVLVMGEGDAGSVPRRILAAIDGSEVTSEVLAWARSIATAIDAEVHVLHVLDSYVHAQARRVSSVRHGEDMRSELLEETDEWIEKCLEAEGMDRSSVKTRLVIGRPAPEILTAEEELGANLVILGSRGAGLAEALLLGGVARKVLHEARSPVFVLPHTSSGR